MVRAASGNGLKILHVIPAVAPRYGGPSRAVFEICRTLRAGGTEVVVATTDADGSGHLPVSIGALIDFNGTETIFFPRQLNERFGYSYPLAKWLDSNVALFDVVHIHAVFSHPCLAAARACRRQDVPYIIRPLGSLDPWSLRQKKWSKQLMWRAGVSRMLRKAAAIHYTTPEEQRLAETVGGLPRGVVIPLGIDMEQFDSTASSAGHPATGSAPYVIVLSRLHQKKNLESLIQAFLHLTAKNSFANWRLVIAGDGEPDYVSELKRRVSEWDVANRIVFTGWLAGPAKYSALRNASLLALPSFQENFGLCVTEGLALGVPAVVSSHVNLAREIESAGAGWVTGLDTDEIERTLNHALSDVAELRRRGLAGRDFVSRNLAWPKIGEQLAALYREVAPHHTEAVGLTPSFAEK